MAVRACAIGIRSMYGCGFRVLGVLAVLKEFLNRGSLGEPTFYLACQTVGKAISKKVTFHSEDSLLFFQRGGAIELLVASLRVLCVVLRRNRRRSLQCPRSARARLASKCERTNNARVATRDAT